MERYGKLENGVFIESTFIQTDEATMYGQPSNVWFENGYKLLNENAKPENENGYWFEESYNVVDNEIVVSYTKRALISDL